MITSEKIENNIEDLELFNAFSCFLNVQLVLGSCRIHFKDRSVSPPTIYQKSFTLIFGLAHAMLYISTHINYLDRYKHHDYTLYLCGIAASQLQFIVYFLNLIHVRFFNNENNVKFIITMQNLDRCLKLNQVKVNTALCTLSKVFVTMLMLIFLTLSIVSALEGTMIGFISGITVAYSESNFMFEIFHCAHIMAYFAIRMRFINSILINHLHRDLSNTINYTYSKEYMIKLAKESHDFRLDDTDIYVKEILKTFDEFRNIYQFQMFLYCSKMVLSFIVYFQIALTALRVNMLGTLEIITLTAFITVNMSVALFICVRCEIFIRAAKETKQLCASIMSIYTDGPLREKAKRMSSDLENSPPRFCVYGMWHIDARYFLQAFSVITALIVTQLQFAVL